MESSKLEETLECSLGDSARPSRIFLAKILEKRRTTKRPPNVSYVLTAVYKG